MNLLLFLFAINVQAQTAFDGHAVKVLGRGIKHGPESLVLTYLPNETLQFLYSNSKESFWVGVPISTDDLTANNLQQRINKSVFNRISESLPSFKFSKKYFQFSANSAKNLQSRSIRFWQERAQEVSAVQFRSKIVALTENDDFLEVSDRPSFSKVELAVFPSEGSVEQMTHRQIQKYFPDYPTPTTRAVNYTELQWMYQWITGTGMLGFESCLSQMDDVKLQIERVLRLNFRKTKKPDAAQVFVGHSHRSKALRYDRCFSVAVVDLQKTEMEFCAAQGQLLPELNKIIEINMQSK